MVLEAIKYSRGSLEVLDQLQLPHKVHYDRINNTSDAHAAIRDMRVRGAPAIAITAILGLAVEIHHERGSEATKSKPPHVAAGMIKLRLDEVVTSRPTAVNLKNMADEFKVLTQSAARQSPNNIEAVWDAYLIAAEKTLSKDIRDNRQLGNFGAEWLMSQTEAGRRGPISVITHCNTGSLATAGYGTALGVIRSLHGRGDLRRAYCTETRPYNQGSRLTAFELVHDEIPGTLITDSMAAALLKLRKESENIAGIVVGADRIAANGDTANKIGTYALALAARHHGVKFLVAAPCSTVDLWTATGDKIQIEERAAEEMTTIVGPVFTNSKLWLDDQPQRISIAARGIEVWNPAFDVTPAALIDAIVTEKGVVEKGASSVFNMKQSVLSR